MKIVVVGTGYVGLACVGFVSLGHEVVGVDTDAGKIERIKAGEMPINEPGLADLVVKGMRDGKLSFTSDLASALKQADICFICVGTPALPDGRADLQYVEAAVASVNAQKDPSTIVVVKSTVPVGTCKRLHTASNPEFLREGSAMKDFLHPDRIVIGADDDASREMLSKLYAPLDCPKLVMTTASSELTKYAANGLLATKISFINEIANICDATGADVRDVAKAIGLDPRIGPHFLNAGLGYGGSCFPKDTRALHQIAGSHDHDFKLLEAVIEANNHQRARFVEKIGSVQGLKVAVWGLAFKAGTDDVRESAAIDIVEQLLAQGATIAVFDPAAMETARTKLGDRVRYASSAIDALAGVDALVVLTEWPEFKETAARSDVTLPKKIFDGRNLLADMDYASRGISYVGVGLGR